MPTKAGYLTEAQHEEFAGTTVSDPTDFEEKANAAERLIDDLCAGQPKFHDEREVLATSSTSTTLKGSGLDSDRDNYYNNLRVRVVQGAGSGYVGRITDYVASTQTATVAPAFGTPPDSFSVVLVDQPQVFPRPFDRDVTGRPLVPEQVSRAVSAVLQYWEERGGSAGYNAAVFNRSDGGIVRRKAVGDFEVEYADGGEPAELVGQKAYSILEDAGLIPRVGVIS